jgi:GH24 family phage-related lysozyme (muramidase)
MMCDLGYGKLVNLSWSVLWALSSGGGSDGGYVTESPPTSTTPQSTRLGDYGKVTSIRGIKFIICEEAPARESEYTYQTGYTNDLSKVNGIRASALGDGNITIGIGIGIPVHDTARLAQYGLTGDMTHAQAQQHSITIDEAVLLLMTEIGIRETKLNAFLNKNKIELSQHQYDALMSFTYNMINGGTTLWDEIPNNTGSSMVDFIREGKGVYNPTKVDEVFNLYVNKSRRQRESDMFNGKGYKFDNNAVKGWFMDSMISGGRPG